MNTTLFNNIINCTSELLVSDPVVVSIAAVIIIAINIIISVIIITPPDTA